MPPRKRARISTGADTTTDSGTPSTSAGRRSAAPAQVQHSTTNLAEILSHLTPAMQRKFLTDAATAHADVMSSLDKWNDKRLAKIEKDLEKQLTTEQTFTHLVDQAYTLVERAANKNCSTSKAYDVAFDLLKKIEDKMLNPILQTVKPESMFETKRNAIEAVRDIYEITLLNTTCTMVRRIVRQNFHCWGDTGYLLKVLGLFSKDGMIRLMECRTNYVGEKGDSVTGPWMEAFEKTYKETKSYGVDGERDLGTAKALEILTAAREWADGGGDADENDEGHEEEYEEGGEEYL